MEDFVQKWKELVRELQKKIDNKTATEKDWREYSDKLDSIRQYEKSMEQAKKIGSKDRIVG
jgi:hypothetical protein